jgi:hypothetical protein
MDWKNIAILVATPQDASHYMDQNRFHINKVPGVMDA